MVVFLKPCTHFFHKSCIVEWHTSARPERDTCPICRRVLFAADPLTPVQIQQLYTDTRLLFTLRPLGPHRRPGPSEEVVSWEMYTTDLYARRVVRREIDRVLISGGKHRWMQVCKDVRDKMLAAGGQLRPAFEPHRDTFLVLAHAIPVLLSITNYDHAIQSRAFAKFNAQMTQLQETLGSDGLHLDMVMRWDGLFVSDTLRVVTACRLYRQSVQASYLRLFDMRAEIERRRARRSMGGLLRRLASNVLPGRFFRTLYEEGH